MAFDGAATLAPQLQPLGFGEPVPFFKAQSDDGSLYALDVAAGRWMVLMAFGALSNAESAAAHGLILRNHALFDVTDACFYGLGVDALDRARLRSHGGLRYLWDGPDFAALKALGLTDGRSLAPAVFLIDRGFRVAMAAPICDTAEVLAALRAALAAERAQAEAAFAPVLQLERVFEPEFCDDLVAYFEAQGGVASGFATTDGGMTVQRLDPRLKRRHDVTIEDAGRAAAVRARLTERLLPMVKRAFQFDATEIERDLICRYSAEEEGFFSAHRDDVTAGTAHRRFAVTVNLNDGYEGGRLRFREFGPRFYSPPKGGAVVFSCSLLHDVTPVTSGVRYALVPFLFDQAAERLRRANLAKVEGAAAGGNRKERRAAAGRR